MLEISLVCATCGAAVGLEVSRLPSFGFELFDLAKQSGFYPVMDLNNMRTLIFCSEICYKKQLTKKGVLRKRLIKDEGESNC